MALDDRRHPEAERLAEYADGVLDVDSRAAVEQHLVDCADCRAVVIETMAFLDSNLLNPASAPASRVIPFRSRRWVPSVVAGLAVAAAIFLAATLGSPILQRLRGDAAEPRVAALVDAVGDQRTVEARLTGGFRYGALQASTRGSESSSKNLSLLAAAEQLQRAVGGDRSMANLHAYGVAQLLLGRYDASVRTLEEAVSLRSSEARLQADLSAAYLARSSALDRADDLPRALEAASRARELAPALAEASFAYALALERLHLDDRSRAAWKEYLSRDSTSGWADEARRHLTTLSRPSAQLILGRHTSDGLCTGEQGHAAV